MSSVGSESSRRESLVSIPQRGRVFTAGRRIRLSDTDTHGRLRLDAIARYLQDAATDDVEETGWGAPDHLWVLRRVRIDVLAPFLGDRGVELVTWCSGVAAVAAGRRWSLAGELGGRVEVDSVWIHLGPDGRPARLDDQFGVYAEAADGRPASTKLELPVPSHGVRTRWPLRVTDIDVLGHMNNAAYWHAVEHRVLRGEFDLRQPLRALLDYRHPIDLADEVELVEREGDASFEIAFSTPGSVNAVGRLERIG